jgi:hypothetical protein
MNVEDEQEMVNSAEQLASLILPTATTSASPDATFHAFILRHKEIYSSPYHNQLCLNLIGHL